jgi:ABC-type nitrate/sulfonate/bicarbonate transport system permease component
VVCVSALRERGVRAWAAEALAGIRWGLSAGIFDTSEYFDTTFMVMAIPVLGIFRYFLEIFFFQAIEKRTLVKWGMIEEIGGQGKKV